MVDELTNHLMILIYFNESILVHLGTLTHELCCSALCIEALFIWFLAAAALALFIYVPYAEYVTGFLNEAGATKHL